MTDKTSENIETSVVIAEQKRFVDATSTKFLKVTMSVAANHVSNANMPVVFLIRNLSDNGYYVNNELDALLIQIYKDSSYYNFTEYPASIYKIWQIPSTETARLTAVTTDFINHHNELLAIWKQYH